MADQDPNYLDILPRVNIFRTADTTGTAQARAGQAGSGSFIGQGICERTGRSSFGSRIRKFHARTVHRMGAV